jgi:hypothetical protein
VDRIGLSSYSPRDGVNLPIEEGSPMNHDAAEMGGGDYQDGAAAQQQAEVHAALPASMIILGGQYDADCPQGRGCAEPTLQGKDAGRGVASASEIRVQPAQRLGYHGAGSSQPDAKAPCRLRPAKPGHTEMLLNQSRKNALPCCMASRGGVRSLDAIFCTSTCFGPGGLGTFRLPEDVEPAADQFFDGNNRSHLARGMKRPPSVRRVRQMRAPWRIGGPDILNSN